MLTFWNDKIRPVLDKHPGIVVGLVGVGAIASAFFGIHSWTAGGPALADFSNYYTTDDGKSVFKDDDPHDIPPFQHDGQEAVRAFLFPGKTPGRTDSIWYLSKMTDEHKQQMEAMNANGPGAVPPPKGATPGDSRGVKPPGPFDGQLVKRPGDAEWVPMGDPKAGDILRLP